MIHIKEVQEPTGKLATEQLQTKSSKLKKDITYLSWDVGSYDNGVNGY